MRNSVLTDQVTRLFLGCTVLMAKEQAHLCVHQEDIKGGEAGLPRSVFWFFQASVCISCGCFSSALSSALINCPLPLSSPLLIKCTSNLSLNSRLYVCMHVFL